MNILYIFTSAAINGSSVQTKVINQVRALNENGVNCKGLFFTSDDFPSSDQNIEYEYIAVPKVKQKYFRSLKQRKTCHRSIYKYFERENPDFDFLYFRYDNAGQFISKLTRKYPGKIFFEHVSAETEEIKLYRFENPLRFNLSSVLGNLEFVWLPLLREKLWGKMIRQNAVFGLCNSEEIAEYEKKIAGGLYPTFIGGDAVKTSDYILRTNIPTLEREFRIVFLKGASTSADFNGLDRLFRGIKNYKGKYKIKLFLNGKNLHSEINMIEQLGIKELVIIGGYIYKKEADQLMDIIHFGVSALGKHRSGVMNNTTIKAREYFARGLPFVYGHHDPDISGNPEAQKYCLEFDANDDPIDFERVLAWYILLNSDDDYPVKMRQFAERNLDYSVKMKRLKKHLEDIKKARIEN